MPAPPRRTTAPRRSHRLRPPARGPWRSCRRRTRQPLLAVNLRSRGGSQRTRLSFRRRPQSFTAPLQLRLFVCAGRSVASAWGAGSSRPCSDRLLAPARRRMPAATAASAASDVATVGRRPSAYARRKFSSVPFLPEPEMLAAAGPVGVAPAVAATATALLAPRLPPPAGPGMRTLPCPRATLRLRRAGQHTPELQRM